MRTSLMFVGGVLALAICSCEHDEKNFTDGAVSFVNLGTTFTPRGFPGSTTAQDITDFYTSHAAYGNAISFHMNWRDAGQHMGEIPNTAVQAQANAQTYQFLPVVGFGWDIAGTPDLTSDSDGTNNTWSNSETRAEFQAMVVNYAQTYKPAYMFLGNEVNTYYLSHTAQEWAEWISEYLACYDAIKAVSGSTRVFTTFQYDHLRGGGAKNGWTDAAQWSILAQFGTKLDFVGLTCYPYFDYETPALIPNDYIDEIKTYSNRGIFITETAWTADTAVPYTGSEQEQAEYVPRLFDLVSNIGHAAIILLARHDFDAATTPPGTAASMTGLLTNSGTARLADAAWRLEVTNRQ